jgi:hypothetical protein
MTPEEMQLLLELGSYGDKSQALDQQLGMVQAQGQRQMQGRSPIGNFGASIGNLLNTIGTTMQEANIRGDQQKLLQKRDAGRKAGMQLASGAAPDMSPLLNPATSAQDLQTGEVMMRGQLADREKNAQMLMASGDPMLMRQGEMMMRQVQEAHQQLGQAPAVRTDRLLKTEELQKRQAEMARLKSPATQIHRQIAQQYGIPLAEGATVEDAEKALGLGEKAFEAQTKRDQANQGKFTGQQIAGTGKMVIIDTKTGKEKVVDVTPGGELPKDPSKAGKAAADLRDEFNKHPIVKTTNEVAQALNKVNATGNTAAGDLSLVFAYMKLLDPGSSVKEGEQADARNTTGAAGAIQNIYNKVQTGERLNPNQRAQFRAEADRLFGAQMNAYAPLAENYKRLAQQQGLAPGDVVLDLGFGKPKASQQAPAVNADQYKAMLQPGERLVMSADGKAKALKPGEAIPSGFAEVR